MGVGMILFAIWAIIIFRLAWRQRMLFWAICSLTPALAVATGYYFDIQSGADDAFGMRPATQLLFVSICFVIASSGILSMLMSQSLSRRQ
ncbi:hypothetical protein CAF53_00695 [Sphingobium sp. LB126]|nr:hypothetical protein CAF53_00695 [Sphingobium sp. LB126]